MSGITVGILTVSDTCFRKEKEDLSGKKLQDAVKTAFPHYTITHQEIVPDDKLAIIEVLNRWVSNSCNLILTTGGTGFSPRDNTPESTKSVIEREAHGLEFCMISKSLEITPMAVLSRPVCGIKEKSIIINLPGSAKGALECLSFVTPAIPHALALVTENNKAIAKAHQEIQSQTCGLQQSNSKYKFGPSKVQIDIVNRARESPYPVVEVSQAEQLILKECSPIIEKEVIPIEDSLGRILAEDLFSKDPFPPFDASMKDGYAISYNPEDYKSETKIITKKVISALAAGHTPENITLGQDEAIRICTGAPIPPNTALIIPVEQTSIASTTDDGKEESVIKIHSISKSSPTEIRTKGSDIPENSKLFSIYERLSSAHIGILASIPKLTVKVFKLPSAVGIMSTGNEVVDYTDSPRTGQIRDTNRLTLKNLLKEHNFESRDFGIAKDDPTEVKNKIAEALSECDIVISTGGVSMGEFDLIKQVLVEDFDAHIHFGRVNMKPGKPTTFATLLFNGKLKIFFGLPGNPVSAGVTCLLFVIPLLKNLKRDPNPKFPNLYVKANAEFKNNDSRPEYVRIVVKQEQQSLRAYSTGNQISSRLNSLAEANGLLLLGPSTTIQPNYNYSYSAIIFGNIL